MFWEGADRDNSGREGVEDSLLQPFDFLTRFKSNHQKALEVKLAVGRKLNVLEIKSINQGNLSVCARACVCTNVCESNPEKGFGCKRQKEKVKMLDDAKEEPSILNTAHRSSFLITLVSCL